MGSEIGELQGMKPFTATEVDHGLAAMAFLSSGPKNLASFVSSLLVEVLDLGEAMYFNILYPMALTARFRKNIFLVLSDPEWRAENPGC